MAKYTSVAVQTVAANQNVQFDNVIPCTKRYITHADGTGAFILNGVTNQCYARYRVSFGGMMDGASEKERDAYRRLREEMRGA